MHGSQLEYFIIRRHYLNTHSFTDEMPSKYIAVVWCLYTHLLVFLYYNIHRRIGRLFEADNGACLTRWSFVRPLSASAFALYLPSNVRTMVIFLLFLRHALTRSIGHTRPIWQTCVVQLYAFFPQHRMYTDLLCGT